MNFGEFDFEEPPSAIIISGKSELPLNSIHITFKNEDNKRIIAEFKGCGEYTERRFELHGLAGRGELSFTFLPGSNFDFQWFRFER